MTISGSVPPIGGPNRAAQAYGVVQRRAPAALSATGGAAEAGGAVNSQELRSVLSDEERAYFDQIASLGPITYGPGSKGAGMVPDAPRGLRLDVRG